MIWISLISSEHSIQVQKNTLSSQMHMEHSPGQTTSWVINQTSVDLRKLKSLSSTFSTQHYETRYQLQDKTVRNKNTWRLNNTFLNNQQVTEEIKREIKKFLETNDNENTTIQNLWDATKVVLRGMFIAIESYLKKQEKHQIDNLTLHLKQLEKEKQNQKNQQRERKNSRGKE